MDPKPILSLVHKYIHAYELQTALTGTIRDAQEIKKEIVNLQKQEVQLKKKKEKLLKSKCPLCGRG